MAGIKGLPSVFNIVITLSILSVANSCAYGTTRTMKALSAKGKGLKFLAYVDKHAFANEVKTKGPEFFYWLLALSGLANFFIWGSICTCHIRFRKAWKFNGHTLDGLPCQTAVSVWRSWAGLFVAIICLIASFYTALYPVGGSPDAYYFLPSYLAAAMILAVYLFWKLCTRE